MDAGVALAFLNRFCMGGSEPSPAVDQVTVQEARQPQDDEPEDVDVSREVDDAQPVSRTRARP
ncbi:MULTISPECIES: hypothetical protein [unclassified Nonomuraea]|uniref:hypothetical protein n=1 Tax=unclassified Nonomuraea TaxID=2593643 RepID=UPI0033E2CB3B